MRYRATLGIALVVGLALAGCGGADFSTSTGIAPPSTTGSTLPAGHDVAVPGTRFVDPQGTYTMQVDPGWTQRSATFVAEVEVWLVGGPQNGFASNVNVLTQSAPGVDLAQYLALSVRNGPSIIDGFRIAHTETVTGAYGQQLGKIEYTARAGGRQLHFLAVIALRNGRAIVATLTAPEATYASVHTRVEPYLETLQVT